MSRAAGSSRRLLAWLGLALLSGCQSAPVSEVWISPQSSMLAVDVLFPEPLNRDPSLVQAWFLKGSLPGEGEAIPEPIPATFVKWSRAYLLDPGPGLYSLVAVTAEYAPPWNTEPIDGITQTTSSGISADAVIFPAELIRRTTAAVAPGQVVFLGLLQVRRGEHISAEAVPADDLQAKLADRLRPGVTGLTGIRAWLARARVVDLENTTFSNQPSDREAFLKNARADLGDSPWTAVIARMAPAPAASPVARRTAPAPAPKSAAKIATPAPSAVKREPEPPSLRPVPIPEPEATPAPPQAAVAEPPPTMVEPPAPAPVVQPEAALAEPEAEPAPTEAEVARVEPVAPIPEAVPPLATPEPEPEPEPFPNVPPDSPLAQIRRGMRHDEVLRILGTPDDRVDRLTAQAWIPFHDSRGDTLRDWIYTGKGRVVFSLYQGSLEVVDVVYDPHQQTSRPLFAPLGRKQ